MRHKFEKLDKQLLHKLKYEQKGRIAMERNQDTYKETRIFEFPNMIVKVNIPDLTPEERARRLQRVYDAAHNILEEVEILQAEKAKEGEKACGISITY